ALQLSAIADADDLQLALEAVLHPRHHVEHERPRQAVQRPDLPVLPAPRDDQLVVLDLRAEPRGDRLRQLALRALGADHCAIEVQLHALRNAYRLATDP